ncbi:MAG TPA: DUF4013 domain-containing protein [Anaerolineae bacterium]|nr:DUF4013 domain-containing protein [Anaerolineae bacterium]
MDVAKSFTYTFEDRNWVIKVLVGGVLSIIPIASFLVGGYMIEVARNIALGAADGLPEWDDWGQKFIRGVLSWLINLIYSLPMILLGMCLGLALAVTEQGENGDALRALFSLCLGMPMALYGLVMALWLPAARLRYAVTDNVAAAFQFREIFDLISANLSNYALAIAASIGAAVAVALAGTLVAGITCGLGALLAPFIGFVGYVIMAHLFGQVYREAQVGAA